jgi:hypothetical protein
MRQTQKNTVHRVDAREPLEKLSLLDTKKPAQSAADAKKTGASTRPARPARWM